MKPEDLQTLVRAALIPPRTEARRLFDDGYTRGEIAADLGMSRAAVEYLTAPPAPVWPVLPDHLIDRLPAHLQTIARQKRI